MEAILAKNVGRAQAKKKKYGAVCYECMAEEATGRNSQVMPSLLKMLCWRNWVVKDIYIPGVLKAPETLVVLTCCWASLI